MSRKQVGGWGISFGSADFLAGNRSCTAHFYCAPVGVNDLQAPAVRPIAFGRSAPERRRGISGGGTADG
jgi:hypothetical protein